MNGAPSRASLIVYGLAMAFVASAMGLLFWLAALNRAPAVPGTVQALAPIACGAVLTARGQVAVIVGAPRP